MWPAAWADRLYGVLRHSLGAMASLFAMAAYPHLEENSFSCRKLVLASAPANLHYVIGDFCRRNSLDGSEQLQLEEELSATFAMTIADYDCAGALKTVASGKLGHPGANSKYFALEETLAHTAGPGSARILITEKCGHNRILTSKQVFTEIIDFLRS